MLEPKRALILGGSKDVFMDMERAVRMCNFDAIIAINDVGAEVPDVDFWCSMHPEKMPKWLQKRRDNGFPDPKSFWTARTRLDRAIGIEFQAIQNTRGGSGLLAIFVARYLGFAKIVLAGIPMEPQGEHYHTPGAWKECRLYRIVWESHAASLKQDVRSMSGWTRQQYGEPHPDWLMI